MEDKFCEGCGWWNEHTDWLPKNGGICICPRLVEDEDYDDDMLVYSYNEGGSFWTGPKFGCVHWKEKE